MDSVGMWRCHETGEIDSDWGVITHTKPRADHDEIGPLILVSRKGFDDLLRCGPNLRDAPGLSSASVKGHRRFFHHDYGGTQWVWELFDAHWTDIDGPCNCYIGRWPD